MRSVALGAALSLIAGAALAQQTPPVQASPPGFDAARIDQCLLDKGRDHGAADPRTSCIGIAAAACMETEGGSTTVGMGFCLDQERQFWDAKLNQAYGEVMTGAKATDRELSDLGSAAEKQEPLLREMQRNWIGFRDAACGFERSRWGGGSGGGPGALQCLLTLTAQQYLWLDQYRGEGQ